MILKTRQVGDPVLRMQAAPVSIERLQSKETQALIDSMIETLRDHPGVGLAAPQVGESLQIIVVEDLAKYHKKIPKKVLDEQERGQVKLEVIINPKLETLSKSTHSYFEGCLSVSGYRAIVTRADKVKVTGLDRKGRPFSITATGWHARILQHEIEHMQGKLYVDCMNTRSFISEKSYVNEWADKLATDLETFTSKLVGS